MYELCGKLQKLTPYDPITGEYFLRLDANESYRTPPVWLREKLKTSLDTIAFNRYPDPFAGDLCRAFADFYGVDSALVTAGNGSDELISILTSCFLETGDTVLTLSPDFSMYGFYSELYEKRSIRCVKDDAMRVSPESILQMAGECGAKAILFSNPCNPTGQGLNRGEVRRLLRGTDALVVLDEAYMDFWDQSLLPEVGEYTNLVILRTCSKALGMASLRVGFAVANPTITGALRAAKSPYNVSSADQTLATAVLSEKRYLHACREEFLRQRDALYAALVALNERLRLGWTVYPTVTNFVFLRPDNASYIHTALLQKGVAIRRMGEYLRITAPSPTELPVFLHELEQVIQEQ